MWLELVNVSAGNVDRATPTKREGVYRTTKRAFLPFTESRTPGILRLLVKHLNSFQLSHSSTEKHWSLLFWSLWSALGRAQQHPRFNFERRG